MTDDPARLAYLRQLADRGPVLPTLREMTTDKLYRDLLDYESRKGDLLAERAADAIRRELSRR